MPIALNAGFANTLNDTLNRHPVVVSESNGFGLALERMRGMAQGSINTGAPNALHDTLSSKAAVTNEMALPFRDTLSALSALGAEKTSNVSASIADQAAEFDPFSVVRSGAVPEDNAFVLALKRLYGLVVDPSPEPQFPNAKAMETTPATKENALTKPSSTENAAHHRPLARTDHWFIPTDFRRNRTKCNNRCKSRGLGHHAQQAKLILVPMFAVVWIRSIFTTSRLPRWVRHDRHWANP
jgi:hypothetical protein